MESCVYALVKTSLHLQIYLYQKRGNLPSHANLWQKFLNCLKSAVKAVQCSYQKNVITSIRLKRQKTIIVSASLVPGTFLRPAHLQ